MADNPASSDPKLALLLSIADAANALGVSRTTLYKLIAQAEIRCLAIGRRRLVPKAELEDFIARQHTAAPNPPPKKAIAARQKQATAEGRR
jgi:excisionase family DNA binding protein